MKRVNDIDSFFENSSNKKEDNCLTPKMGINERKRNTLFRPVSILNLVSRSSINKSKDLFPFPISTRNANAKSILFKTEKNSKQSSLEENIPIYNSKKEVELINDLNDLVTNIKYKDYLLNKIQSENDILLMENSIKTLTRKCEQYYKALSVKNSKTITSFNNDIERESLERIKDYNECFSICFKLYEELVSSKEHNNINNSNINVNVNFNVNNISATRPKCKAKLSSRVLKREHKVSMDDNMISLLNEEKTKINTLHLYNFQVSKQQNGTKIIKRELNCSYDRVRLKK